MAVVKIAQFANQLRSESLLFLVHFSARELCFNLNQQTEEAAEADTKT